MVQAHPEGKTGPLSALRATRNIQHVMCLGGSGEPQGSEGRIGWHAKLNRGVKAASSAVRVLHRGHEHLAPGVITRGGCNWSAPPRPGKRHARPNRVQGTLGLPPNAGGLHHSCGEYQVLLCCLLLGVCSSHYTIHTIFARTHPYALIAKN